MLMEVYFGFDLGNQMTLALAVIMGNLIGEVTAIDRGTATQENLKYMRIRVNIPVFQPLIPGVLRLE